MEIPKICDFQNAFANNQTERKTEDNEAHTNAGLEQRFQVVPQEPKDEENREGRVLGILIDDLLKLLNLHFVVIQMRAEERVKTAII